MEMMRDTRAGERPGPAADHAAGNIHASPEEAAARTRELYAQYAESARETHTATPVAAARRPRRARTSRARATDHAPTHEAIAVRAYELYAASGSPHGRDVEFWLEAERQLKGERET